MTWTALHPPRRYPYRYRSSVGASSGERIRPPSSLGLRVSSRHSADTPRYSSAAQDRRSRPNPSRRAARRTSSSSCGGHRARASGRRSRIYVRPLLSPPSLRAYCVTAVARLLLGGQMVNLTRLASVPLPVVLLLGLWGNRPWA